ncbi:RNA polymerase sigma-70 factor (ECF subfamily) [Stella humosa]|uniref:RNA polymerase sigma-70 factor (ECF subfamily) n=1 Tax=Stella humosa TaxID=94 RepID=A0A3N1L979_9PROT|nr:sigma-70 family RNA polymerase sigma factor [Stella humosa]ROP91253.1 RNA polymerase sigma-70 factor (ECF subfamily) [Stella humosa]BBK34393.1 RNA polymerase sigma factor [Stella humosa]
MAHAAAGARQAPKFRIVSSATDANHDTDLVARVAAGDRLALRRIHERFQRPLVGYLLRFVRDHAVAEELAAEVMVGVWRQAARYEGRSSLETWVFGIAHNKAVSWLRKRREEGMPEGAAEALVDERADPEAEAEASSVTDMMTRLIARLSAEQQAALQLTYYQEMPLEQVASAMGCPVNTVKTRIYYARQHLKRMLADEGIAALAA